MPKDIPVALTYDDVLLVPRFSSIKSRRDVDVTTRFTGQIPLQAPFVSSNMDTVTEARMAIAMAEFGGIGVVHRFLPVDAQVAEVSKVKQHNRTTIEHPHTISPDATVGNARRLMERLGIHGLPVVKDDRTLVGILTYRDIHLTDDRAPVSERMTSWDHLVVAPSDVSLAEARQTLAERRLEKLPLVDARGSLVGLITARDLSHDSDSAGATRDPSGRLRVAAAVGVTGDFKERAEALVEAEADALVIDIAHGDSTLMVSAINKIKERQAYVPLAAGNVATAEGTQRLIDAGVDAIKVGVGPGATCITREVAGVGVPQLTAVMASAEVAHANDVPVIADGGIRYAGDVAKAIGAGASTVMLGSLLAGTDESPGVVMTRGGLRVKMSRGMASAEASVVRAVRDDPAHGWARWELEEPDVAAEGVQFPVAYVGATKDVLGRLLAGLRSGMSYSDAADLEQMWKNAQFVRQTEAGLREAGAREVSAR